MTQEFASLAEPHLVNQIPPGESLRGIVAASQSKTFSATLYGVGITESRLILQPFDRKVQPKGAATIVSNRAELATADLDGAGNGWLTAPMIVMSAAALTLRIRAENGEKFKLMLMKGGGAMTGGESQRTGVLALAELLRAART